MNVIDLYQYFKNRKNTKYLSDKTLNFKVKRLIFLNNEDNNITNFNYLLDTNNIINKINNNLSNTSQRIHLTLILLILNNMLNETEDEDNIFKINKAISFYNKKIDRIKKMIKINFFGNN